MTTSIKTCFKCGEGKSLAEFYKHPAMADGRLGKCKECTKLDARNARLANIEYYREYDRKRGNRLPDGYMNRYATDYPAKSKARHMVNNAVRDRKLLKGSCEICGSEIVHGHHDDYLKPLDVRWLCPAHHRQWHVRNGEAKNAGATEDEFWQAVQLAKTS